MNVVGRLVFCGTLALGIAAWCRAEERPSLRVTWRMPPHCMPFDPVRIKDLKEELRQTGYRLVIAIHPAQSEKAEKEQPPRDLYIVNADGTGLKQLTATPDKDETVPRTSPDGKRFTYNYGDYVVDVKTLKSEQIYGGYAWTPDSQETAGSGKNGIQYFDMETGKRSRLVRTERRLSVTDLSCDGKWFIFELRDYLGSRYSIDYISSEGGEIHKMPNHPIREGECHPTFSPDGQWICWNGGGSLAIRKFDGNLPGGTEGEIVTLPLGLLGQDPCGRWSHCGRYIAYTKIPHLGSWRVHSPICIVRLADNATITISPPGWVGHHWDYDWLPPAEN